MDNPLQDHFVQLIRIDIEKNVLPNLPTVFHKHYPELEVTYKPKDPETFLYAYVIGNLEGNYHTLFIQECGIKEYDEDVYFAIHRFVGTYKARIMTIVKEFLKN